MDILTIDLLAPIRELLADPTHWCKHDLARDSDGLPAFYDSPEATSWCLAGATYRCYPGKRDRTMIQAELINRIKKLHHEDPSWLIDVALFNDAPQRTHEEIMRLLEEPMLDTQLLPTNLNLDLEVKP